MSCILFSLFNPFTLLTQLPTPSPLTAVRLFSVFMSLFLVCIFIIFCNYLLATCFCFLKKNHSRNHLFNHHLPCFLDQTPCFMRNIHFNCNQDQEHLSAHFLNQPPAESISCSLSEATVATGTSWAGRVHMRRCGHTALPMLHKFKKFGYRQMKCYFRIDGGSPKTTFPLLSPEMTALPPARRAGVIQKRQVSLTLTLYPPICITAHILIFMNIYIGPSKHVRFDIALPTPYIVKNM